MVNIYSEKSAKSFCESRNETLLPNDFMAENSTGLLSSLANFILQKNTDITSGQIWLPYEFLLQEDTIERQHILKLSEAQNKTSGELFVNGKILRIDIDGVNSVCGKSIPWADNSVRLHITLI